MCSLLALKTSAARGSTRPCPQLIWSKSAGVELCSPIRFCKSPSMPLVIRMILSLLAQLALAAGNAMQNETWLNKMVIKQTSQSNETEVEAHFLASFSSAKKGKQEDASAMAADSKTLRLQEAEARNHSQAGNQSLRSAASGGSLCESYCTALGYEWTHCWSGSCKCSDNFYEASTFWCSNGISGCKSICGTLGHGWAHCRGGRCLCNDNHHETSLSC